MGVQAPARRDAEPRPTGGLIGARRRPPGTTHTNPARGAEAVGRARPGSRSFGLVRSPRTLRLSSQARTTHLGELEVREGEWHVRLRGRSDGPWEGRRVTDSLLVPACHDATATASRAGGTRGAKAGAGWSAAVGSDRRDGRAADWSAPGRRDLTCVGSFQNGSRAVSGTRVRAGAVLARRDVSGSAGRATPATGVGRRWSRGTASNWP